MRFPRTAATTACLAFSLALVAAPAHADPSSSVPAASATKGLFGTGDPTYDGVYRQSFAILGLIAVGKDVPRSAIGWLLRQQCANGSFAAYRADTRSACPKPDATTFTGSDSNSTAAAALALQALHTVDGRIAISRAHERALRWLRGARSTSGGWAWIRGLQPDSVSTAMAIAALGRSGQAQAKGWLAQQMTTYGCSMRFQPGAKTDPLSTSWTFLATGKTLPLPSAIGRGPAARCPDAKFALRGTGSWLAGALQQGDGTIRSAYDPTAIDWNVTALATLAMANRNGSEAAMRLGVAALKKNVTSYAQPTADASPGALGTLLMVAHAARTNPRHFGPNNLIHMLLATLQR